MDYFDDEKIKKNNKNDEQFKALFHFLDQRDTFARSSHRASENSAFKTHLFWLFSRFESCQRLKLKVVKMEQELFDNDDALKELEEAEVLYYSLETLENILSK